jgi:dihydrofolate reductase
MGRVVVSEFVSVDGVMEAPGGEPGYAHSGWVLGFQVPAQVKYKLDEVLAAEALLIGRRTYESFAGAWPQREGEFADRMNAIPKYVASTTLTDPEWSNTTVLDGDVPVAVAKLKAEVRGDILVAGSRALVNTLAQHDLVDEYRLMVFPIVLGSGMRLFDTTADATTLRLVDTQPLESGTVILTYHVARPEVD